MGLRQLGCAGQHEPLNTKAGAGSPAGLKAIFILVILTLPYHPEHCQVVVPDSAKQAGFLCLHKVFAPRGATEDT